MPNTTALKRGEKTIEINGGNVVYEILGKEGDFIVLTPGGRFSKDIPGLRPLAQALVKGGYRVVLWDRPNCGKSDVQFYGQSESHMRAETLRQLITQLDIGPCIIAGGSGGARDSILTTMLYPEIVRKLVVWNIVGGLYGTFVLGSHYVVPTLLAFRGNRMEAVIGIREWRERIAENPANKQRFLDFDADRFLRVMLRWLNAYMPKPGQTIPGRHHGAHVDHSRRRERLRPPEADVTRGELPDQGIPTDRSTVARGLVGALGRGDGARQGRSLQQVRHLGAGGTGDPEFSGPMNARAKSMIPMTGHLLHRDDADLAVGRGLQSGVNPALRDPRQVALAQRHGDDVPALVAGHPVDRAGQPESGQHAMGVVVGATADERQHTDHRISGKSLGAQADRDGLQIRRIGAGHQDLDLPALRRQCGEVVVDHLGAYRGRQLGEFGHAGRQLTGAQLARRIDADTHHRRSHVPKGSRACTRPA
jgi:pimeloyl-ACP methyl ester carboxylesterase